jgi:hypothetical protein
MEQNKKIAKALRFKELLNQLVEQSRTQYHTKIVNSMLEVIESQEPIDNQDDNEDEEDTDDEFNEDDIRNFIEFKGYLWVDDNLIEL